MMTIGSLFSGIGGLVYSWQICKNAFMPRGAKPKKYPERMVQLVRQLYENGMTQIEVAEELGTTQKVIWNLMRRHGIKCRPQIKRNQAGAANACWRGVDAGYSAKHLRVATIRGKPSLCEVCGTPKAKRFEWANINGNYDDVWGYVRMCCSCHHTRDGTVLNIHHMRRREAATCPKN